MEYVPKVLAAAVICSNPQRYGLESPGTAVAVTVAADTARLARRPAAPAR
jgi:hypothetical protein